MRIRRVLSNAASLYLTGHAVTEARDRGWDRLLNGDLLVEAEQAGFDMLLRVRQEISVPYWASRRPYGKA